MKLLPHLSAFIAGAFGYRLGRPFGVFVASLVSLIATVLAFYYARKYQKSLLG